MINLFVQFVCWFVLSGFCDFRHPCDFTGTCKLDGEVFGSSHYSFIFPHPTCSYRFNMADGSQDDDSVEWVLEVIPALTREEASAIVTCSSPLLEKDKNLGKNDLYDKALVYLERKDQIERGKEIDVERQASQQHYHIVWWAVEKARTLLNFMWTRSLGDSPSRSDEIEDGQISVSTYLPDRQGTTAGTLGEAEQFYFKMLHRHQKLLLEKLVVIKGVDYGTIHSIDYVHNERLERQFQRKKEELKLGGHPSEEALLFHGTRHRNVDSILRHNFQLDCCRRRKHGRGVSLSAVPSVCLTFGPALILCRVLPGRVRRKGEMKTQFESLLAWEIEGVAYEHIFPCTDNVIPYCVFYFDGKEK